MAGAGLRSIGAGLLGLSVTFNVLLALKVNGLRTAVAEAHARLILAPGEPVLPLDVGTADGSRVRVDPQASPMPTVVYTFDPACSWCARNWSAVREVVVQTRGRHHVIGLSLSALEHSKHPSSDDFPGPIYQQPSEATRRAYGLGATPQTIVIAPSGRVLRVWRGAYFSTVGKEIEAYFNVRLPAMQAPEHPQEQQK